MKIILTIAAMAMLSPLLCGDNRPLIAEKTKELTQLNKLIVSRIKNLKKYNNKSIYVKVRVVPKGKERTEYHIEKISVDKIEQDPKKLTGKVIYLKGKVEKVSDDKKYKLDLSHVLPEEDDTKSCCGSSVGTRSDKNRNKKGVKEK